MGLIAMRQVVGGTYTHVGVTDSLMGHGTFYLGNRGQDYLFPLYLYEEPEDEGLQSTLLPRAQAQPNLKPEFRRELSQRLGVRLLEHGHGDGDGERTVGPEDVLGYMYAVLNSPSYRQSYGTFLMQDFPRVPLTGDRARFVRVASLGRQLMGLHLLKGKKLASGRVRFPVAGHNRVEQGFPKYVPPGEEDPYSQKKARTGRVYINDEGEGPPQYFDDVEPDIWSFESGGYPVFQRYLEARVGRDLSYPEREHLLRVFEAVRQTLDLLPQIDDALGPLPLK
jgi:hypothetical protein